MMAIWIESVLSHGALTSSAQAQRTEQFIITTYGVVKTALLSSSATNRRFVVLNGAQTTLN